jgi:hypothetical protein
VESEIILVTQASQYLRDRFDTGQETFISFAWLVKREAEGFFILTF